MSVDLGLVDGSDDDWAYAAVVMALLRHVFAGVPPCFFAAGQGTAGSIVLLS